MKKLYSLLILIFCSVCLFAAGNNEENSSVRLAVMQGPTGFSSVFLDESIKVDVYPSPNEAVSKIINGELDMAVLPVNTAVNLFNKGVGIKAISIVGEGMLSIVGSSVDSVLYVPGMGGTPDQMASFLYTQYEPDYSITSPSQLAQLVIAGKVNMAILPEPFVSMILSKNSKVEVLSDVQEVWKEKTGLSQYPMSILVTSKSFAEQNPKSVKKVKESFKDSINKVLANPKEAAVKIEELGIMKAALAEPAIPNCELVYIEKEEARSLTDGFLEAMNMSPVSEDFWLK